MKVIEEEMDGMKVEYRVGQSMTENHTLLDESDPGDLWIHVKDLPSCHVRCMIHSLKLTKKQRNKVMKRGGLLCKIMSKPEYRKIQKLEMICARMRDVEKTDTPGEVKLDVPPTVFTV